MIIFRRIKSGRGLDKGHDRLLESAFRLEATFLFFSGSLLLRRMVKNNGAILIAHVGSLAIQRGWIVVRPKDVEELIVTDSGWIEFYLHHFGMTGLVAADISVSRILGGAP